MAKNDNSMENDKDISIEDVLDEEFLDDDINSFCPIVKSKCLEIKCKAWDSEEEDCSLFQFFKKFPDSISIFDEDEDDYEDDEEDEETMANKKELIEFIDSHEIEELASEILNWTIQNDLNYDVYDFFNEEFDYDPYDLSRKYRKKANKALDIAYEKYEYILQERETKLQKEKEENFRKEMETLIPELIEWTKSKLLKKISKTNIRVFLHEKGLNYTPIQREILYMNANERYKL